MSKYIDAEKLYKEVDALMVRYTKYENEMEDDEELSIFYQGKRKMCSEIINLITSLQQEQPEVEGIVHHEMNVHYIVTNQKQLDSCLKKFDEGAEVIIHIKAKEG